MYGDNQRAINGIAFNWLRHLARGDHLDHPTRDVALVTSIGVRLMYFLYIMYLIKVIYIYIL